MPALDFTAFPSKPAAPPAVSAGAPRQTGRTGAPKAGAKTGASNSADGGFGQLVDRLADAPEEGKTPSAGVSTRRSRETVLDGEESAAEPRAKKGDADGAGGTANDAPAVLASVASTAPVFPWTLPINPSLWNIEQVQVDDESAGETGDGDSVIGAATTAIADGAAGACFATLPDSGTDAKASTAFEIRVDTPIPVNPAVTTTAAESAAPVAAKGSESGEDDSAIDAIDTFAWTGAAAAAGAVSAGAGANVTETETAAGGDSLATAIARAGQANATVTGEPISGVGVDSAIGLPAASALANKFEDSSSVDPNDSALLAQSAMDAATMAAAVEGAPATTAAGRSDQANAAIDGPLPADQAREQALIELQRALESVRPNAPAATVKHASNGDGSLVIQTGASAGGDASGDAAAANAAASAAIIDPAAANAGDISGMTIAATGETGAGAGAIASASGSSGRSRQATQASEDSSSDSDNTISGASAWAAAAAAKYAEAAGAGTSDGSDLRDSGSNADAAANVALAGRAGGDAGNIAPIGFDARVVAASRADSVPASELPGTWAGESAIVTTAAPEDQAAQIVRSMRLQWRGTTGEATLRLQPDHLGQVFVSVRVENGAVSATVRAETPAAQQWIQQHQQQLRDALDAQGLRVAQFHVTSNPDDRPRRDHEQDQNQDTAGRRNRARARNNDAGDRRFEIHL
jgi:flagellar hook-length control protein FliK